MNHTRAQFIASSATALLVAAMSAAPAVAAPYLFSTGNVDGRMAVASRPASTGKTEIEAADDFVIAKQTHITSATFIGLLQGGVALPSIQNVAVEIYRVFPLDSTNPPSGNVPTRVNSPSDVALAFRDAASNTLAFSTTTLSTSFTAANSVSAGGIHPIPNHTTGGGGAVTGSEVEFTVTFSTPIDLAANHYFFVPQVQVSGGEFFWLSSVRPIVAPGTPFAPDLQAWVRDANLDPNWLRVGTDIVGGSPAPTFNEAFTLTGQTTEVPEPSTWGLFVLALTALLALRGARIGRDSRRRGSARA